MATSIATGALPPRVAVALSGLLNLVGAFLSLAVAATIATGLVNTAEVTLQVVAAGLAGGIIWNLLTWLFGIPSSSSHIQTAGADSDHVYGDNVLGLVIAAICFLIILAALGWGIYEVYQIGHPAPAKH
jgi:inorganic phosphate transporter, PiT family